MSGYEAFSLVPDRVGGIAIVGEWPRWDGGGIARRSAGTALVQEARKAVAAWHEGEAASRGVLRVVYFHPSDRDPLPDYADRLDRVLTDVSGFYRDGLRRFGVANEGLPLEKKDGKLVLHVVKGNIRRLAYQHESGDARPPRRSAGR